MWLAEARTCERQRERLCVALGQKSFKGFFLPEGHSRRTVEAAVSHSEDERETRPVTTLDTWHKKHVLAA